MTKQLIKLPAVVIAIIISIITSGCGTNSNSYDSLQELSEIESMMDIKFPEGTKILNLTGDERNGESAKRHIIYAPSPVRFNTQPVAEISAEIDIKIIEKNVSSPPAMGKLKDRLTRSYEGEVKQCEWHASQTNFENGSYLIVDKICL